ncbi:MULTISPECIES: TerB family tellurite resistance protein [Maribacter]|uniref:TerB family tellurite resistance protein n=1 Tax=Maribacter flavus TaxID=1658664 RepID=A0ABU7II02_9FLAO|nr:MULTISPECIES: TerB family tellurite resistance protein [Maribacter]MDC6405127.1 TerB family tellurite resistance protein [Maribacter sp. PR66]MEE1972540.1 TerB family tellurite resistance protein [Maribacter flavus]
MYKGIAVNTLKEKLSILSEMIAFARVDNTLKQSEYDFLFNVAQSLEVSKREFDGLFQREVEHIIPKSQAERLVQFNRLILLMNIDDENNLKEIERLHDIGLRMGLPPSAIEQVLSIMHEYPNKIVPPEIIINIFKAHYN